MSNMGILSSELDARSMQVATEFDYTAEARRTQRKRFVLFSLRPLRLCGEKFLLKLKRIIRHHDGPVLADVEEQAGGHEAGEEGTAAVADEGQSHAGDGHHLHRDH